MRAGGDQTTVVIVGVARAVGGERGEIRSAPRRRQHIPADRLKALYTPFMQVDTSTTRKFGGTDLGLSIVRRLVELMNGETGVDSEEGVGSTFWFTACFERVVNLHQTHYPAPASIQGRRVLVVDDNATNRKVLMGQLLLCGVEPDGHSTFAACAAWPDR
jgi:hypothetical protein